MGLNLQRDKVWTEALKDGQRQDGGLRRWIRARIRGSRKSLLKYSAKMDRKVGQGLRSTNRGREFGWYLGLDRGGWLSRLGPPLWSLLGRG